MSALRDTGQGSVREHRLRSLEEHPTLWGLDFVSVNRLNEKTMLHLVFIPAFPGPGKQPLPDLTPENVVIWEADRSPQNLVRVTLIQPQSGGFVAVLDLPGATVLDEPPLFTLELVDSPTVKLLDRIDRLFRTASFSLAARLPEAGLDEAVVSAAAQQPPEIDYLAKDFSSFRKLMLDRLSQLTPGGIDTHIAGTEQVLVEILAHAADQMSYYQDAVGTEAYLGTSRQRISLRRHARLLDFALHEGCNARVWVHVACNSPATLAAGSKLLTKATDLPGITDLSGAEQARRSGSLVFETMYPIDLDPAFNLMEFDLWGGSTIVIPRGATTAALSGNLALLPTQVLVFEEVATPAVDHILTPDPHRRHPVRLSAVRHTADPLRGVGITEIDWLRQDALPFDLTVTPRGLTTIVRGNVVLADHGESVEESLELPGAGARPDRPALKFSELTFRMPFDAAPGRSARALSEQDPADALPAVRLIEGGTVEWTVQRDLLGSDRFSRDFVVEVNDEREPRLRFGDGLYGRRPVPGLRVAARYRVGNGTAGNVGQGAVGHLILGRDDPLRKAVQSIGNPLAASGGTDPQNNEQVRQHAPQAYRRQERGVTAEDYANAALRHPDVVKAAATTRWTGSWFTTVIVVDRASASAIDEAFCAELLEFLERFRIAGRDLQIRPPRLVGLDIEIEAVAAPDRLAIAVERSLRDALGVRDLPDGSRGFFHPANFTLGQPVYWSQVAARALQTPGVERVGTKHFDRVRPGPRQPNVSVGRIDIGALEIARLAAGPDRKLNGRLDIVVTGGR